MTQAGCSAWLLKGKLIQESINTEMKANHIVREG